MRMLLSRGAEPNVFYDRAGGRLSVVADVANSETEDDDDIEMLSELLAAGADPAAGCFPAVYAAALRGH